jgi:hypothetical protein
MCVGQPSVQGALEKPSNCRRVDKIAVDGIEKQIRGLLGKFLSNFVGAAGPRMLRPWDYICGLNFSIAEHQ